MTEVVEGSHMKEMVLSLQQQFSGVENDDIRGAFYGLNW